MRDIFDDCDILFEEEDINLERLLDVFNTKSFEARQIAESILIFRGLKNAVSITIDDRSGTLQFRTKTKLRANFRKEYLGSFIEHLNTQHNCSSFYHHTDDDGADYLCGSAFLIYHLGLSLNLLYYFVLTFVSSFIEGCRIDEDRDFFDLMDLEQFPDKIS